VIFTHTPKHGFSPSAQPVPASTGVDASIGTNASIAPESAKSVVDASSAGAPPSASVSSLCKVADELSRRLLHANPINTQGSANNT